jgi:hypothetical protein
VGCLAHLSCFLALPNSEPTGHILTPLMQAKMVCPMASYPSGSNRTCSQPAIPGLLSSKCCLAKSPHSLPDLNNWYQSPHECLANVLLFPSILHLSLWGPIGNLDPLLPVFCLTPRNFIWIPSFVSTESKWHPEEIKDSAPWRAPGDHPCLLSLKYTEDDLDIF